MVAISGWGIIGTRISGGGVGKGRSTGGTATYSVVYTSNKSWMVVRNSLQPIYRTLRVSGARKGIQIYYNYSTKLIDKIGSALTEILGPEKS